MPLTFPTSPTNGQTTTLSGTTYTYNATKGVWEATASGGGFVAGSFSEHILPSADDTYDIGSASNKIRDLYVSDNSLHIGDHTMSADSEGINIPALKLGTGSNRVKLTANAEGKLRQIRTVGGVAQAEEGISSDAGTTAVDTMAELQASPVVAGKTVLVRNTNKLYINTGTGWYIVGQVTNESPTAITGLDATYALALDGTATVITMNSTDPEGFPLTWSHAVTTGTLGSTATITNVDNVFTITPSSTEADAGSFSVTFSVSDGSQAATSVSDFTLIFSPPDDSSILINALTSGPLGENDLTDNAQLEYTWTVPNGLASISAVAVGAGGGGSRHNENVTSGGSGGGGGLAWANEISVTSGETLTIKVGRTTAQQSNSSTNKDGRDGGASGIYRGSTLLIEGGGGMAGHHNHLDNYDAPGGGYTIGSGVGTTSGGGSGGGGRAGTNSTSTYSDGNQARDVGPGGGGAGGYTGDGGQGWGGGMIHPYAVDGSGGGGAGGSGNASSNSYVVYQGGGGVGVYGLGANGVGQTGWPHRGGPGSGGTNGDTGTAGSYGGGGAAARSSASSIKRSGKGAGGAVRILWGSGRAFPTTSVDEASNVASETVISL